jgi:hypothetical protein
MIFGAAIQSSRQNSGNRCLADATVATEDIAVGGSSLLNGVLECPGNVLLSNDLGELQRTVFAGQDGVTHAGELIIRDVGPVESKTAEDAEYAENNRDTSRTPSS